jgi:hypothetical protein
MRLDLKFFFTKSNETINQIKTGTEEKYGVNIELTCLMKKIFYYYQILSETLIEKMVNKIAFLLS